VEESIRDPAASMHRPTAAALAFLLLSVLSLSVRVCSELEPRTRSLKTLIAPRLRILKLPTLTTLARKTEFKKNAEFEQRTTNSEQRAATYLAASLNSGGSFNSLPQHRAIHFRSRSTSSAERMSKNGGIECGE